MKNSLILSYNIFCLRFASGQDLSHTVYLTRILSFQKEEMSKQQEDSIYEKDKEEDFLILCN